MEIIPDTIILNTNDFKVKPGANILVNRYETQSEGQMNNANLLAQRTDGELLMGSSAIVQSELNDMGSKVYINKWGYLTIQFSGSRIKARGLHNLLTLNTSEFTEVCDCVGKTLNAAGVLFNINECGVNRIDVATDRAMKEDFKLYLPIFMSLRFKRKNDSDLGTTYYSGNKQHDLIWYDKIKCCNKKGMQILSEYIDRNIVRCEYRLKSKNKVTEVTGFKKLSDIIKDYNYLASIYNSHLKSIFNYNECLNEEGNLININSTVETELHLLEVLKMSGKKSPVNIYNEMKGHDEIIQTFGSYATFINSCIDRGIVSKQNGGKQMKKHLELLQFAGQCRNGSNANLMNELIEKFIKAA